MSSIDDLPKIPTLTELFIGCNHIVSVARIANLFPELELLDARDNKIEKLQDVFAATDKLGEVVELFLKGNPCANSTRYPSSYLSIYLYLSYLSTTLSIYSIRIQY